MSRQLHIASEAVFSCNEFKFLGQDDKNTRVGFGVGVGAALKISHFPLFLAHFQPPPPLPRNKSVLCLKRLTHLSLRTRLAYWHHRGLRIMTCTSALRRRSPNLFDELFLFFMFPLFHRRKLGSLGRTSKLHVPETNPYFSMCWLSVVPFDHQGASTRICYHSLVSFFSHIHVDDAGSPERLFDQEMS